jgi:hypothetical protein
LHLHESKIAQVLSASVVAMIISSIFLLSFAGAVGYRPDGITGYIYSESEYNKCKALYNICQYRALYRYYDLGSDHHFYTTNKTEGDEASAQEGWYPEGITGYLYPQQQQGTVPLYRYYNPDTGDHFYTTNKTEGDEASAQSIEQLLASHHLK